MDEKIQKIMLEKIDEAVGKVNEISSLINSLDLPSDPNSFGYGVIIGRLYNSFYYQTRRVLKREPTSDEFTEFIEFIKKQHTLWADLGGFDGPFEQ